jgi:hypothetical protein
MKNLSLIIILIFIFNLAAALGGDKLSDAAAEMRSAVQEKAPNADAEFIKKKKNDPDIYWGEGIATIQNADLGAAREVAKERALNDLSQKIKVFVESDISHLIQGATKSSAGKLSEENREVFIEKVNVYTRVALSNIKDKFIADYPVKNNCTYFAYISKSEYERTVNEDIKIKKAQVKTSIANGDRAFEQNDFMIAANHWTMAYEQLEAFFGGLPLQDDLNNDGRNEDVASYIYKRVNNLFGKIQLSFIADKITYDASGVLTKKPIVQAKYTDAAGKTHSVANLPLKVDFVSGTGWVNGAPKTSEYGEAIIPLKIDASNPSTVINVKIDVNALPGLNAFRLSQLSEARLTIGKIKTIAVAAAFFNRNKRSTPAELMNEIKRILINNGFLTIEISLNGYEAAESEIARASSMNADYMLTVTMKTSNTGTVGGYANMYVSTVSGLIALYKLPRGDQIAAEIISAKKGYGVSGSVAGWDGYGKIKKTALNKTKKIISEIRQ